MPDQVSLGQLIQRLSVLPADRVPPLGFKFAHSYRGYYDELAFEPARGVSIGEMLKEATGALGHTFSGYKGGDYTMEEHTPVWLSEYGTVGETLGPILLAFMLGEEPEVPA